MKKTLFVLALGVCAQASFATPVAQAANAAGATIALTSTNCTYLKDNVNIKLSANVSGAVDCTSTAAGVAAGSAKGNGKVFSVNSDGGAIAETSVAVATIATGVGSQATSALPSSSSSSSSSSSASSQ